MSLNYLLQIITETNHIIHKTTKNLSKECCHFVEKNMFQKEYTSREEFDALKKLVLKLEDKISKLEGKESE